MKFGKEEAMGMLMAVEMWMKRDHKAEMKQWIGWLNNIASRVEGIDSVTTAVREPRGLSNRSPGLSIRWNPAKLGITGEEISQLLFTTEPRIALGGGAGGGRNTSSDSSDTGISISAFMMMPGEDKIVADRIRELLSQKRPPRVVTEPKTPAADLAGRWDVTIEFASGRTAHVLHLNQSGNRIVGTHQGDFQSRDITGTIEGDSIRLGSFVTESHGDALSYQFSGNLNGDTMSGALDMGEYLSAKWTAKRYSFNRPVTA